MIARLAALFALLAGSLFAQSPELFFSGKPQLGRTLNVEIDLAGGGNVVLLLDTLGGPATAKGVTFGVGFSPSLILLPLTVPASGSLDLPLLVPNDALLDGVAFFAEVATLSPIAASGATEVTLAKPLSLDAVNDFAYRLQGANGSDLTLTEISASAFDLCVVDFSRDGAVEFTSADVAGLLSPAEPERRRLAYMSIGEAEDYRWYWNSISPAIVASSNPAWPGNFKVFYWDPEWREVIITGNAAVGTSYLDRVIDQGFDGVYLDIIDAFEFFGPAEAGGEDARRDAAREMIDFVVAMAYHARFVRGRPDFLVVPQNGANILEEEWYPADTLGPLDPPTPTAMAAAMRARYFSTIDAIGVEDIFYFGGQSQNNPFNPQAYLVGLLEEWTSAGIPVLSIEYLTQASKVNAFYDTHAPGEGFIPYATVRPLDKMTVNTGHEPD